MDFETLIKTEAKRINLAVKLILQIQEKDILKKAPALKKYIEDFRQANLGGKYLRGFLVSLGYQIAVRTHLPGVKARLEGEKEITKVAAAYEIFHTSILAHDDIIDQNPTRRNKPSLYNVLGTSQTICLGDWGFFLALKIISQSNFLDKEKIKALNHFSQITMDTALGEMLDVLGGDVNLIMQLKTARYTVSGPLQLGAILAGGKDELIRGLGEFGESLGVAFQIQDDILGVFGSEMEIGKSNKSDIEEGKNTILIVEALKKASHNQKKILKKYYGAGKISEEELLKVREVFKQTGALDYAQKMALSYVEQSKKMIPEIVKQKNMSTLLVQMAEYLVGRSK